MDEAAPDHFLVNSFSHIYPSHSFCSLFFAPATATKKTRVLLNVYDLSPANEYLYPIGFGLHHTGVEIDGREYSFGSGSGIFDGPPKEAPGAAMETVPLGKFSAFSIVSIRARIAVRCRRRTETTCCSVRAMRARG